MIFMRFNEWVIFIKESRNWCASKCWSINYCLIEKCDNDDDDNDNDDSVNKTKIMNLLWHINKYRSIDCCLIEKYDNDDDNNNNDNLVNKVRVISFFWCLWNELMRILLISWILI